MVSRTLVVAGPVVARPGSRIRADKTRTKCPAVTKSTLIRANIQQGLKAMDQRRDAFP